MAAAHEALRCGGPRRLALVHGAFGGQPPAHLLEGHARRDGRQQPATEGDSKFPLGQVVVTRTALATLPAQDMAAALDRHRRGDWGDVGKEDWRANEHALKQDERSLSVYHAADGTKFWIIASATPRNAALDLLPS